MTQTNPAQACANCGSALTPADAQHQHTWCTACRTPRGVLKNFLIELRVAERRQSTGHPAAKPSAEVEHLLYESGVWSRDRTADQNDRALWGWLRVDCGIDQPWMLPLPDLLEQLRDRAAGEAPAKDDRGDAKLKRSRGDVEARLIKLLRDHPEYAGCSCEKLAAYVGCAKSTITATKLWKKTLLPQRKLAAAAQVTERQKDRRRRPTNVDRWQDD